jgi:hypothetical protein
MKDDGFNLSSTVEGFDADSANKLIDLSGQNSFDEVNIELVQRNGISSTTAVCLSPEFVVKSSRALARLLDFENEDRANLKLKRILSNAFVKDASNFTGKFDSISQILDETVETHGQNISFNHENFNEVSRWTKRAQGTLNPCRLIKLPLVSSTAMSTLSNNADMELIRLRFNSEQSSLTHKPFSHNTHLVIKQKKYKPLKSVGLRSKLLRDLNTGKNTKIAKYSGRMNLLQNSIFEETKDNTSLYYKFLKKFKRQNELVPLTL